MERPGKSSAWLPEHVGVSLAIADECRTCLVYHIDKGLCVISRKTTDRFTLIVIREDRLDQGREFTRGELAFDQSSTGCNI